MPLLHVLQHSQAVPFSLTQCYALRFHAALGHPRKRTFLHCANRTFSLCSDRNKRLIDKAFERAYDCVRLTILKLTQIEFRLFGHRAASWPLKLKEIKSYDKENLLCGDSNDRHCCIAGSFASRA